MSWKQVLVELHFCFFYNLIISLPKICTNANFVHSLLPVFSTFFGERHSSEGYYERRRYHNAGLLYFADRVDEMNGS